jgi:hypothetical protein
MKTTFEIIGHNILEQNNQDSTVACFTVRITEKSWFSKPRVKEFEFRYYSYFTSRSYWNSLNEKRLQKLLPYFLWSEIDRENREQLDIISEEYRENRLTKR